MDKSSVNVETLLQAGWGYHDSNSSGLAIELEGIDLASVAPAQAAVLLKLSNHTMGEHLKDWPRACVLARQVWQQIAEVQSELGVAVGVYVAEQLGGDPSAAASAELAALAAIELTDPIAVLGVNLQCKALLAAALVGSGSLERGAQLYIQVVDISRALGMELNCDRVLAITSNNLAGELLAIEHRTVDEGALMLTSASAALEFWQRCGTWLNEARALYLLQNVNNELQDYSAALAYGEQAFAILSAQGSEPVDEAFVLLTLSASQKQLGLPEQSRASLVKADALVTLWEDASLRSSFAEERRKVAASNED